MVTGATNGLGLAPAEELAEAVHQSLPHGRAPQRPVPIAQRFGVEQYIADPSAPAEPQRLATEVAARRDRPDALVNNAGVGFTWNGTGRSMSADGHQERPAVDRPSPVLLTRRLLPLLRAGSPSHSADIASAVQEPMESKRYTACRCGVVHERETCFPCPRCRRSWTAEPTGSDRHPAHAP
ncbi:SDR family NAD(P)-dependent oxidoreductase [Streptomyces sp. NPDC126497]|uniref:SDR family NAD(P)-dependent oxidoreductase n=1 Tax=Streptomyces sp. NPDC126497 TaxID=3155313 RepID=UPI00332CC6EB